MMQVLVAKTKLAFEPLSSCAMQHGVRGEAGQLQKIEP